MIKKVLKKVLAPKVEEVVAKVPGFDPNLPEGKQREFR